MEAPILQVVTDTDRRGAQVFAMDLHAALERRGRLVRTVALTEGPVGGLSVEALGNRRLAIGTLTALRRQLREAVVVIAHGSTTLPACAITRRGTGAAFVYRQISDSRFWAPRGLRRFRTSQFLRSADRVVALSAPAARTLQTHLNVDPARIRVVPNGVPVDRFLPASPDDQTSERRSFGLDPERPVALFVGALVPEKGADLAIDSAASDPALQLLVAGDGPERARLETRAAQVAPGRVVFAGSLADPRRAYAAADVVVLPSRSGDSMPAALIEAGLMRLPTVATRVGSVDEIVLDGVSGLLVPKDDADSLARTIEALVSRPAWAHELGEAARRYCVDRFSIDVVAASWDEVLREACESVS